MTYTEYKPYVIDTGYLFPPSLADFLGAALVQMAEETFCYHVNETKSDFSNWVRDVIGDDKLSRDLKKNATSAQAARSIAGRIVSLMKKTETE